MKKIDENTSYEELLKQRDVYRNSEKIYSNLNSAYQNLYDGSVNSVDLVGNAVKELSFLSLSIYLEAHT